VSFCSVLSLSREAGCALQYGPRNGWATGPAGETIEPDVAQLQTAGTGLPSCHQGCSLHPTSRTALQATRSKLPRAWTNDRRVNLPRSAAGRTRTAHGARRHRLPARTYGGCVTATRRPAVVSNRRRVSVLSLLTKKT
jgi:hypothetical protein